MSQNFVFRTCTRPKLSRKPWEGGGRLDPPWYKTRINGKLTKANSLQETHENQLQINKSQFIAIMLCTQAGLLTPISNTETYSGKDYLAQWSILGHDFEFELQSDDVCQQLHFMKQSEDFSLNGVAVLNYAKCDISRHKKCSLSHQASGWH